jgi:hypothetical protein
MKSAEPEYNVSIPEEMTTKTTKQHEDDCIVGCVAT